ncbi:MAG: IS3 family transposase [Bacteroidota bacterium]
MRQTFPNESLEGLCALFGVTRQAYYEAQAHERKITIVNTLVLGFVSEFRKDIPMLGTRKLQHLLIPRFELHGIKMGRDRLFDLLRFHGLLIRRRKRMVKTTDSHHWLKKYPNLTLDIVLTGPEQLWVSDITYIRTQQGFSYLSLITDAYSRKIMGYALCPTLEAVGCIEALQMAIANRKRDSLFTLIHHSDRGIQYCSAKYIELLRSECIEISMTQSGSPYENALAERVNGIIKNEFYSKQIYQNHQAAKIQIDKIVTRYNSLRPHSSIDFLTPEEAHLKSGIIAKRWKKYPTKKRSVSACEFSEASTESIL